MSATKIATAVEHASRQIPAVVVSAGLMAKTVKVRIGSQQWNAHIRKKFSRQTRLLVHDPRSSLREGDIISISPGWRASKHVHHVVSSIIAPFGEPIEARPPVPSAEERIAEREAKRNEKGMRRRARAGGDTKSVDHVLEGVQEGREREEEVKGVRD